MRASLLLALLATVAGPVFAADSECGAPTPSGAWKVVECFLCDGDHSSTDCAEFDLHTETTLGLPNHIVADLAKDTGCDPDTVEVAVRGMDRQLGIPHIYATLNTAGTSAVLIEPLFHRHLDADVDITTSTGCTDVEVVLRLFYPIRKP